MCVNRIRLSLIDSLAQRRSSRRKADYGNEYNIYNRYASISLACGTSRVENLLWTVCGARCSVNFEPASGEHTYQLTAFVVSSTRPEVGRDLLAFRLYSKTRRGNIVWIGFTCRHLLGHALCACEHNKTAQDWVLLCFVCPQVDGIQQTFVREKCFRPICRRARKARHCASDFHYWLIVIWRKIRSILRINPHWAGRNKNYR